MLIVFVILWVLYCFECCMLFCVMCVFCFLCCYSTIATRYNPFAVNSNNNNNFELLKLLGGGGGSRKGSVGHASGWKYICTELGISNTLYKVLNGMSQQLYFLWTDSRQFYFLLEKVTATHHTIFCPFITQNCFMFLCSKQQLCTVSIFAWQLSFLTLHHHSAAHVSSQGADRKWQTIVVR